MKNYMAARRVERRRQLIEMSGGSCVKCNSKEDLEFNHLDREQKLFNLSGCHLDKAWSKILDEWKKCELVCKVHHLEYTRKQYENLEIRPWNDNTGLPYVHGTVRCYQETKCKCDPCREAKRLYRSKYIGYDEVT